MCFVFVKLNLSDARCSKCQNECVIDIVLKVEVAETPKTDVILSLLFCSGQNLWLQNDRRILEHELPKNQDPLVLHYLVRSVTRSDVDIYLCISLKFEFK